MTLAATTASPPASRRGSQSFGVRIPTSVVAAIESEVERATLYSRDAAPTFNGWIVGACREKLQHCQRNRSKRKPSRVKLLQAENDRLRKIIEQLTKERES